MGNALKKIHVTMMALLLTIVGQVRGEYNDTAYGEFDSCCCEPACGKGFISAGLLYWRAYEGGLDDCFPIEDSNCEDSCGNIISRFRGKGEEFDFNWDAGFRLGVGYEFPCGWDISVFWTDFHSTSSEHRRNEHRRRWKLDFDVVDIIAGYRCDVCSCLVVRPFVGLRGADIEQKLRTNIFVGDEYCSYSFYESFSNNILTPSSEHWKEKFLGIGPLIGVEADWNVGCGLSFYANVSFGVLYGNFHVRFDESNHFENVTNYCNIKRHLDACQAVVDAGLGIRWQTCLCNHDVWLQLGLEHHRYFNQNRFGHYGDLCLDGANFSAGVAF